MAIAYVADTDQAPATGSSFTYTSFAVSGTNPVIIVLIALDAATEVVNSVAVSAGLSAGTPVEVKALRSSSGLSKTYVSIWAIPAPTGTGTITVTLSGSVPYQSNAILLSGADQTTPCPTGDAVTATGATNPLSVTPTNLTANDAAVGAGANAEDGDAPSWDQTSTFNNNTTAVNMAGGYHLGTGAVSCTWGIAAGTDVIIGVRVVDAGGGGDTLFAQAIM